MLIDTICRGSRQEESVGCGTCLVGKNGKYLVVFLCEISIIAYICSVTMVYYGYGYRNK